MFTILKQASLTAIVLLVTLIACLSACGAMIITTWLIDVKYPGELVRKDKHNEVVQRKAFADADKYRCYSPVDDEAWRKRMSDLKACCGSKD